MLPNSDNQTCQISGRISPELSERLQAAMKRKQFYSKSRVFREALHMWLDHHEEITGSQTHLSQSVKRHLDTHYEMIAIQLTMVILLLVKGFMLLLTMLRSQNEPESQNLEMPTPHQFITDAANDAVKTYCYIQEIVLSANRSASVLVNEVTGC